MTEIKDNQRLDFEWFCAHKTELLKKYGECFIAIKDKQVLGTYNDFAKAIEETSKMHELGTFIVQENTNRADGNMNYVSTVGLCII